MRVERFILMTLLFAASLTAIFFWRKAAATTFENAQLQAEIADLEKALSTSSTVLQATEKELAKMRKQSGELMSLRGEITQLRSGKQAFERMAAENQQLRAENQQLRAATDSSPVPSAIPASFANQNLMSRDAWIFAGYASPEDALVSAIWAMTQGDPQTYLESLAPEEQKRMAQSWQGKSEAEIAEKHRHDVAHIASLRVLERQNITPGEMVMSVYLEGPNQTRKIRMNQIGQEWKFGGFLQEE